jgi:predicted nucleic acid-binding protein
MEDWYRIRCNTTMATARKITVEVPDELLERAQKASGSGMRYATAGVAQTCIDPGIALLTRDKDFRAFAYAARLNLIL